MRRFPGADPVTRFGCLTCVAALAILAGLLAGTYLAGDFAGAARASTQCHEANLRAEVQAQDTELVDLRSQLAHQRRAATDAEAQRHTIAGMLADAQARAKALPDSQACRLSPEAVGLLNRFRTGQ